MLAMSILTANKETAMGAVISLIIGLFVARYLATLKSVVLVQAVLFVVASGELVATAPAHDASYAQGAVLSGVGLLPLTALVVLLGRLWRTHSGATASVELG